MTEAVLGHTGPARAQLSPARAGQYKDFFLLPNFKKLPSLPELLPNFCVLLFNY